MGIVSRAFSSYRKSKQLRKLQLAISPRNQSVADLASHVRASVASGVNPRDQALVEYLDLCERDAPVAQVMTEYQLSRADLKNIYIELMANGLGQWIKGHYAALSTIAYYEPLLYCAESTKRGQSRLETFHALLSYWEGRVPQGGLLGSLNDPA